MGERRELYVSFLGHEESFRYSEEWVGYSLLFLRLAMGWLLFYAGITKVLDSSWSASGYLMAVPEANPLTPLWTVLAGVPMVDVLVMAGLTLTGLFILLGLFFRFSAFWATLMMLLFWASSFPLEHSMFVDDHVIYAALLFGLGAFGAGRLFGVDSRLEETEFARKRPWTRYVLG